MTALDLRPLSLGEILDRTFTLYRRYFLLFIGITAIPHVATLVLGLVTVFFFQSPVSIGADGRPKTAGLAALGSLGLVGLLSLVVALFVYLIAQGGTIIAVSELYLGRTISIGVALRRVSGQLGNLFGVLVLNGLAIVGASLLLVVPGIYLMCRLLVCMPAAVIEGKGPAESLSRSWYLTKGYAGRAFLLYLLYFVIAFGLGLVAGSPTFFVLLAAKGNPEIIRTWQALTQVLTTGINVLVTPLLLIATSVFYYDLRVRKEAFDLQFMMDPTSEHVSRGNDGMTSIAP